MNGNTALIDQAQSALAQDRIDVEEYNRVRETVKMANTGLTATRNQFVSSIQSLNPKPVNETADGRRANKITIVKPRVLIAE